jgi:hypothetical protein
MLPINVLTLYHGRSGSRLVLPVWRQFLGFLVISTQSVNTTLNQNKMELAIPVSTVSIQMLSHGDSLLNEEVDVLWELWAEPVALQDAENLATGDRLDLGDAMAVTEDDTDLRWGHTLLCHFEDLVIDLCDREEEQECVSREEREGRGRRYDGDAVLSICASP